MTNKKKNINLMKMLSLVIICAMCAGIFAGCSTTPNQIIYLDVNPSVEIEVNAKKDVVAVRGVNEDAKKLLAGYKPDDDLDDVIEDIVDRMILSGYLENSKANDVLITVKDDKASKETLKSVNDKIASYLDYRQVNAKVMGQSIDLDDDLDDIAVQYETSAGKMALIARILSVSGKTREELSKMRISELLDIAKEKHISLNDLDDYFDDDRNDDYLNDDDRDDERDDNDRDDDNKPVSKPSSQQTSSKITGSSRTTRSSSQSYDNDDDDDRYDDDYDDDDRYDDGNDDDNDDDGDDD